MGSKYLALIILNSRAKWRLGSRSQFLAAVIPEKSTSTDCTGGRAGLRTDLDGCGLTENDFPNRSSNSGFSVCSLVTMPKRAIQAPQNK